MKYAVHRNGLVGIGFVAAIAVIGVVLLLSSHAATPATSVELETGSILAPAAQVTDSTASGQRAAQFNTPAKTAAYPDSSNTGVAIAGCANPNNLPTYTGPDLITVAGTTITCMDIPFKIEVRAANVTLRGNRIHANNLSADRPGGGSLLRVTGAGTKVIDNEIRGNGPDLANVSHGGPKLGADNMTFTGNNVYWFDDDGITIDGDNMTITDNYIHDFENPDGAPVHFDGMISEPETTSNRTTLIQHNHMDMWPIGGSMNNVITMYPRPNFTIDNNLIAGGNQCVSGQTNWTNNKFSTVHSLNCGYYGVGYSGNAGALPLTWKNNTWYDGPNAGQQAEY